MLSRNRSIICIVMILLLAIYSIKALINGGSSNAPRDSDYSSQHVIIKEEISPNSNSNPMNPHSSLSSCDGSTPLSNEQFKALQSHIGSFLLHSNTNPTFLQRAKDDNVNVSPFIIPFF